MPVSTTDWIQSQLITTTSGQAYSQLIDWITDNQEYYASYQPITVSNNHHKSCLFLNPCPKIVLIYFPCRSYLLMGPDIMPL